MSRGRCAYCRSARCSGSLLGTGPALERACRVMDFPSGVAMGHCPVWLSTHLRRFGKSAPVAADRPPPSAEKSLAASASAPRAPRPLHPQFLQQSCLFLGANPSRRRRPSLMYQVVSDPFWAHGLVRLPAPCCLFLCHTCGLAVPCRKLTAPLPRR